MIIETACILHAPYQFNQIALCVMYYSTLYSFAFSFMFILSFWKVLLCPSHLNKKTSCLSLNVTLLSALLKAVSKHQSKESRINTHHLIFVKDKLRKNLYEEKLTYCWALWIVWARGRVFLARLGSAWSILLYFLVLWYVFNVLDFSVENSILHC